MKGGGRKSYREYTKPLGGKYVTGKSPGKEDDCIGINFQTSLQKTQAAASSLIVGESLIIKNVDNALPAIDKARKICGYIVSTRNEKILACIEKGRKFKATVLEIGASYKVRVENDY